ncbi:MAG TPA: hypothetical protein VFG86_15630 [Chloroflexota bacterium]|jgi:hypothetical protein|nr:hypothetical protein [Chloroflexota bacterium]
MLVLMASLALMSERDRQVLLQLGPLDGWRCLRSATYVYEPRWHWFGGGLLAEAPDTVLPQQAQTVEVDLKTGEAIARAKNHVYVLQPGRLTVITDPEAPEPRPLCVTQLGNWQIVGEHTLG